MRGYATAFTILFEKVAVDKLHLRRLVSVPNVFMARTVKLCIGIHMEIPLAAGESETLRTVWREMQSHMMLRDMEHLSVDRPIEYLGREYQLICERGQKGVKTRVSKKVLQYCAGMFRLGKAKPSGADIEVTGDERE